MAENEYHIAVRLLIRLAIELENTYSQLDKIAALLNEPPFPRDDQLMKEMTAALSEVRNG